MILIWLGKESQPTDSGVYVLLHKLMTTGLKTLDGDSGTVKDMKKRITDGLKRRFKVDSDGKPNEEVLSTRAGSVTPVSRYRDQFTSTLW